MINEINSALTNLNRFNNFSYKLKTVNQDSDNDTKYVLYKQFHQVGKNAKSTKFYPVELLSTCSLPELRTVINVLLADRE